jgi:hypothetical protein
MKMWFAFFAVVLAALICLPLVPAQTGEEEAAPAPAEPAPAAPAVEAPAAPAAPAASAALTWQEAMKKDGETVTVEAKVVKVYDPEDKGKTGPVKLNVDQDYKTSLTFVYFKKGKDGKMSEIGDPKQYLYKTVRVTGKVDDYKGSKQIMIKSAEDIQIVR